MLIFEKYSLKTIIVIKTEKYYYYVEKYYTFYKEQKIVFLLFCRRLWCLLRENM